LSSASERENLVQRTILRVKLQPCTCPLRHCPFNNLCELCIKNHRLDGTLPYCMLPPVPERDNCGRCENLDCEYYPDCRSPALWLLYYLRHPEELEKEISRLKNPRLVATLRHLLQALREARKRIPDYGEEEEREARKRRVEYASIAAKMLHSPKQ